METKQYMYHLCNHVLFVNTKKSGFIFQIELEDDNTKDVLTFDFSHWVGEVNGDIRKELPVMRLGKSQKQGGKREMSFFLSF